MTSLIIASYAQEEAVKQRPEFIPYDESTYAGPEIVHPQVITMIHDLNAKFLGTLPGHLIYITDHYESGKFWKIG